MLTHFLLRISFSAKGRTKGTANEKIFVLILPIPEHVSYVYSKGPVWRAGHEFCNYFKVDAIMQT